MEREEDVEGRESEEGGVSAEASSVLKSMEVRKCERSRARAAVQDSMPSSHIISSAPGSSDVAVTSAPRVAAFSLSPSSSFTSFSSVSVPSSSSIREFDTISVPASVPTPVSELLPCRSI
jgi:hypothetical protein